MNSRPSTAAPVLAALAIVAALLGAYVAGYFWLAEYGTSPAGDYVLRLYRYQWLTRFYQPAAFVEGKLRRAKVELGQSTMLPPST